jgi:hypothetical protein
MRADIRISAILLVALATSASEAVSQVTQETAAQPAQRTLLPDTTAQRIIGLYNRAGTTHMTGDSRLPSGTTLTGDLAAINGSLDVGGHVTGDIVVINGDAHILPTAVVDGSITTTGGSIRIDPGATVANDATAYRETLRYREEGDRIVFIEPPQEGGLSTGRNFAFGRTDLLLAMHGSYNRVEGLPFAFGPRITLGKQAKTRVQALAVYRTTTGFDVAANEIGYLLNAEHYITDYIRADVGVYREIATVQDWGFSDREASIAAFALHQDFRDHYEREGWSAGLHMQGRGSPLTLTATFRNESDTSIAANDPYSILKNDENWRAEPLVAEGTFRSITGAVAYDTRNDASDPRDGWWIRTSIDQGIGGSLKTPSAAGLQPISDEAIFTDAHIDLRRYTRFTPYSHLALRIYAAGSLDGDALPAQRQENLGGEGSLPAYPMEVFDCGSHTVETRGTTFNAYRGCDRTALAQIEYQASFPLARKLSEKLRFGSWLSNSVRWAAFFDAGRAWNEPDARRGRGRGRDDFSADTGLGLRLGPLGLYWAFPLSGSTHDYNFFMRLGPRI